MDYYRGIMESFAEWMTVANMNGNLFLAPNGVQVQALSLTTTSGNSRQNNSADNESIAGKTVPIRCIVESVANVQDWNLSHSDSQVEVDRRANVPAHTIFHNLVEAVLQIFGYPKETAVTAKGSILIENWKPMKLEKIAVNSQKTVSDILGHISSLVTLRIHILKTTSYSNIVLSRMKDKLLEVLIMQNGDHMMGPGGCPLDQVTLKSILCGATDYAASMPSEEVLRKFEQWIIQQSRQPARLLSYPGRLGQFPYLASPNSLHYDKDRVANPLDGRMHPALQTVQNQYPTQKTRMRTSFDPELELPKLQKWFAENQHPDRQQIRKYVDELNSLESRRGRKPLDVNNVVYWFKNARAAQKRTESRVGNATGVLTILNGYRSDSHSPCDTALTSKESLGSAQSCDEDYIEDDDNRSEGDERDDNLDERPSSSPVAPLSLTTRKDINNRSRNSSPVEEMKDKPPDKTNRTPAPAMKVHDPHTDNADGGRRRQAGCGPESDDEEMEDDGSETESVQQSISDHDSKVSLIYGSSPALSMLPSPVANNHMYPLVPNYPFSVFGQYLPGMNMSLGRGSMHGQQAAVAAGGGGSAANNGAAAFSEDKRGKRNRTFIDPVSEVPCLERWFLHTTHPTQALIQQYTDDLNSMSYRQKFPPLETKNVQFWFKNRRAKCKRLKTSLYENMNMNNNLSPQDQYHQQLTAVLSADNYRNHD